jgi:hypothetical protein
MTRVRWLQTSWPFSIRTLAARLKRYTFHADAADGFLVERVRDSFLQGQHFEKVFTEEVIRDPFGNETTFSRLSYRQVEFQFSSDFPQIELRNFPRGLQAFLTRTSQAIDFAAAFVAVEVDVFRWADSIRRQFPKHFRIDLAQLADVFIEDDVTAKVVLTSPHDIGAAFARFADGRKHTVERIQINFDHDGTGISIQLSADGTLRSSDELPVEMLEAIRETLPVSPERLSGK